MKKYALYLMALIYAAAGLLHFILPAFYLNIMPSWMPFPSLLVLASGIIEFVLAAMLLISSTRKLASWLIIAMLIVFFFAIHIPQSILFYKTSHPHFIITLIRLPIQFLLIAWAYKYTKNSYEVREP